MQFADRAKVCNKRRAELPIEKEGFCVEASNSSLINSHEAPGLPPCFTAVVMIDQGPRIIRSMPSCCGDSCRDVEFLGKKLAFRATEAWIEAINLCERGAAKCRICALDEAWRDKTFGAQRHARE
jgi:hypothetical protein